MDQLDCRGTDVAVFRPVPGLSAQAVHLFFGREPCSHKHFTRASAVQNMQRHSSVNGLSQVESKHHFLVDAKDTTMNRCL